MPYYNSIITIQNILLKPSRGAASKAEDLCPTPKKAEYPSPLPYSEASDPSLRNTLFSFSSSPVDYRLTYPVGTLRKTLTLVTLRVVVFTMSVERLCALYLD